jgi:hypothetical protein
MTDKTPGELVFEEYLRAAGITNFEFERTFPETLKRPDYCFRHDGQCVLVDVKDFHGEAKDFSLGFGFYDPYRPIRTKIGGNYSAQFSADG